MMQIINRKSAPTDGCSVNHKSEFDKASFYFVKMRLLSLFIFLFFFITAIECRPIVWQLQEELSLEEQDELKLFFHNLFAENELGYTLFGEKPMSFCFPPTSIISISTKENVFKIYAKGSLPLFNALKAWNKVRKINKNFSLIIHEKNGFPESVFLINKKCFFCVFNQNIDSFRNVYGSNITAESFLKDLEDKKIEPKELFQQHLLLGILLGYGRHNAELFERREVLLTGKKQIPFSVFQKPLGQFSTVGQELDFLDECLKPIYPNNSLLLMVVLVNFVADHQWQETHILQQKYKSVHKALTALFFSEDWFYLLLEKLLD